MKKLLYILGSSLLKKVLLPPAGSSFASQSQASPKFNVPYLSDIARRYLIAASFGLLFSLFFVTGTSMALFSAAQSFDLFGVFVPTAVFFTGIGLMAVSLLVMSYCYYSIRSNKILKDQIYIVEEDTPPALRTPLDYAGLVQPFFHGLMAGWRKENQRKHYARAQDELFPADEDTGHAPRRASNVTDIRVSS